MQALETHDVFNQFDELTGINLLQADAALQEVLQRQQAQGLLLVVSHQLPQQAGWRLLKLNG